LAPDLSTALQSICDTAGTGRCALDLDPAHSALHGLQGVWG